MLKKDKVLDIVTKLMPYFLIIVASFVSTYTLFFNGLPYHCDDIAFHLSQVGDLVYGFEHGYFGLSTNHEFFGGFALYNYGFYGPLPHYSAAILTFLTKWAGGNIIFGVKAIIFLSAIMGGIFFYKLAKKISNNVVISLISTLIFIFLPYRIFCALCRFAFSETVAICFLPMIFYGAYRIIHDEEYSVSPYIYLILGAIGVILSHPFTGLMTATFGVIYVLFNIKKFIKKRNGFNIWPSLGVSIALIFCGVGFYVVNAASTKMSGIYRLCDPVIDWTTFEHVSQSTLNSTQFSGFINLIWINGIQTNLTEWNGETVSFIVLSIIIYMVSVVMMVISDKLIQHAPKNKYYRHLVVLVASFLFPIILRTRVETFIAVGISVLVYIFINSFFERHPIKDEEENKKLLYSPDFYFLLLAILVNFILIFVPDVWRIVPSIYLQCQFAWRLWGLQFFFIAWFIALILSYVKVRKSVLVSMSFSACLLLTLSQGLIEKRAYYQVGKQITYDGESYATTIRGSGAQNEMVPLIYYQEDYTPEYENSLFYKVRYAVYTWQNYFYSIDDYYPPVFLEGEGSAQITMFNTPQVAFDVNVTSETALLQLPQFYADGYICYVDGKECSKGINVDGLVSFNIPKGNYSLSVVFKCSNGYQVLRPFFYIGIVGICAFGIAGKLYSKKLSKSKEESSENSEE